MIHHKINIYIIYNIFIIYITLYMDDLTVKILLIIIFYEIFLISYMFLFKVTLAY